MMVEKQTNPIKHIANWVKGEVWSLEALIAAKEKTDYMDTLKDKTIKSIADTQDTINKLNAGKFTFGSMLKATLRRRRRPCRRPSSKLSSKRMSSTTLR